MITRKDVVISAGMVRIKKTPMGKLPTMIGSIEKISGWWWTWPAKGGRDRASYAYREDAIAALIERWNAEQASAKGDPT